ncbi:MAG: triose-phosphate isomerase [Bacillota bacterium]|nr:triose-phosphate isomerase [Bacillota bacterium]
MRRPVIAANWKMHKSSEEAEAFLRIFVPLWTDRRVEVVICPSFVSLERVAQAAGEIGLAVGAQDVYWEAQGAFTGEVSADMLVRAGCSYVIVGHSERRKIFNELDTDVGKKAQATLIHGLSPVICVGETMDERKAGLTGEVVERQLRQAVRSVERVEASRLVIAYEPVWAIGTGVTATPADAALVAREIRSLLDRLLGPGAGEEVRVQYGGSVKASNIAGFMESLEVDGALVGGASLDPAQFADLVNNSLSLREKE